MSNAHPSWLPIQSNSPQHIDASVFDDLAVGDSIEGTDGLEYAVVDINDRDSNGFIEALCTTAGGRITPMRIEQIATVLSYADGYKGPVGIQSKAVPYCTCGAVHVTNWTIPHADYCWLESGQP